MAKVVLAYSGGLDTSITIPWLKENYGYEVIAMVADLGQGEDYEEIRAKALKSGASGVHVRDVKQEFIRDFIFPLVRAGAVYEGKYLLGTSAARPLIAKCLVEVAEAEGAEAIAHGATGKGNDQVRFEVGIKALNPGLKVIAPWREWHIRSRQEAMEYAAARDIPVPATKERPFSVDRNLWHLSHEGGLLEDPGNAPPDNLYLTVVPPECAPDTPRFVEIEFEEGVPKRVDGVELDPVGLLERLNAVGGANGVGIADMVENRLIGMKSRGIYETPGGTIIIAAHRELELLTLDRNTLHFKDTAAVRYAELVYDGLWFTPLREALDAFVAVTQKTVTGRVRMKLYKGNCVPAGIWSPYSLYDQELSTFEKDDIYDQRDAAGFINLFGLPVKMQALVRKRTGG
ncbi:MAG: argininosuccinate synthase [Candidatus Desulforudis sp.]|nr:argininosuccinate synthase [Desulforudis sp.]